MVSWKMISKKTLVPAKRSSAAKGKSSAKPAGKSKSWENEYASEIEERTQHVDFIHGSAIFFLARLASAA